jgi:hypothetical protein
VCQFDLTRFLAHAPITVKMMLIGLLPLLEIAYIQTSPYLDGD